MTVPGEDGLRVLVDKSVGGTRARLEFERGTSEITRGFEVTYLFPKTRVWQELRLIINDRVDETVFEVRDNNEASSFKTHQVEIRPDGRVVAYKLGKEPWRFVHVFRPDLCVHDDTELKKLNWSKVPDVDKGGFIEVYRAQNLRMDNTHSFDRQVPMLEWLRDTHGQKALARFLFELVADEVHNWHELAEMLDEQGREHLYELLRDKVRETSNSEYFAIAHETGAIDLATADPTVVARGSDALLKGDHTLANAGTDLAEYLRIHAGHDLADASGIACDVVGAKSRLAPNGRPYATDYGRPLALVAFATLAKSGIRCKDVDDWKADPCTACGGGACSDSDLKKRIDDVLATPVPRPEIGKTPDDPEGVKALIVGAAGRTCAR